MFPAQKHEEAGLPKVKHQFKPIPGGSRKQDPTQQPEAARLQGEQIRPTAAGQGSVDPSLQQSANPPYSPAEQPYLQSQRGLPGILKQPGMQKNGPATNFRQPQGYPGQPTGRAVPPSQGPQGPKQMGNFVPPGPPASINPAGSAPGPTNNENFTPIRSYTRGNLAGSGGSQWTGSTGYPPPGNTPNNFSPGNNQQLGGKRDNVSLRGSPPVSYSGGSFQGMQGVSNRAWETKSALRGVDPLAPSGPKPPQQKRKKRLPIWGRIAIGLLVFLIMSGGGALAYYEIEIAPSLNNMLGKQAIHRSTSTTGENNTGTVPTGRTNILLLGSDTDGKGNDPTNGTPLAQTIMIITVDPQTNYVGMLSIPRDMQVIENGYTEPKLDEVFSHGYAGNNIQVKVAGGVGEMEDIIQYNFGIHIDHYAWVGLDGFIKVINTAGGIDVDTIHPMVDDTYPDDVGNTNGSIYDYKRLYIAPGPQHLNGAQALDYVRTRHSDLIGDFGRTIRQQQIIGQLKTRLATPDSIGKASDLLQDLNGAVQTDMQLNDIIGLGNLARGIDSNTVDHLTLGPPDYAVPNTNGTRTSNYLPVCSKIVPAIQKMFNITSPDCVAQIASNSSSVAQTTPSPTTSVPTAFNTGIATQPKAGSTSNDAAKNNATPNTENNVIDAGVHSLLDLLFATTFESFDAMQI